MADEDKDKAEKLAAAKKRFEQIKKGKKGGSKKKDDKAAASEVKAEDEAVDATSETTAVVEDETNDAAKANGDDVATKGEEQNGSATPASPSLQSKQRSQSFRQGSNAGASSAVESSPGTGPSNPGLEVQELYKKQAARIEELEQQNRTLSEQQEEHAARHSKAEDELSSLREESNGTAELKVKAEAHDRMSTELASVRRELVQLQQTAKSGNRRVSVANPDLSAQLASKTSTLESLELELSNHRNQVSTLQATVTERDASISDHQEKVKAAESATESYKQELDQLKVSMAFPSDETKAANEDPEALTKRITVLESDLRTAESKADVAQQRATSLEQKIEALTKLHRDTTSATAAKDKELAEFRSQLKRRDRPSHVRDTSDFELGDEETETGALQTRIRTLEAENFDLRRGVWRDKRAELQPGIEDGASGSPEYEDVDLNGPYTPAGQKRGSVSRQTSTFQDVITSGISAFTGRPRDPPAKQGQPPASVGRSRNESIGLLSDDGGFDEDAFRLAQEEEAKRRVERVKDVKRGLDKWKGWRIDLTEQRQQTALGGARDSGPVFEL